MMLILIFGGGIPRSKKVPAVLKQGKKLIQRKVIIL